ncbi:hypothetical protein HELRODRAFT_171004 [Helobdella robusta]|uniref:Uncharacterized protein n=1 Tax=Helobdella robusta TaxID=6412 RepID=T1F3P3_HELRO|nr:hypothetical protein HELRODRAFT_171004 [Helobdella robusta]ESO06968.1 hypothetical protein HELRODRAFT_171004 [Helobdella robusta]
MTYNSTSDRVNGLLASLDPMNSTILQINSLVVDFNNTDYFNIPERLIDYELKLNNYQQLTENYTASLSVIKSIDVTTLATNIGDYPYISMPATNSTLVGLIANESLIFKIGEDAFNSLNNYNTFVKSTDDVLNGFRGRVGAANQSMLSSENQLNIIDPQLKSISLPYINNIIINDIARQKAVTDAVLVLADDLFTTNFYVNASKKLVEDGAKYVSELRDKYNLKIQVFSPTGNRTTAANSAKTQAQTISTNVDAYCAKISSLKNTISANMMNLSSVKLQMDKPLLTQNNSLLDGIITRNIDTYVSQVAASVNTILSITPSADAVNNVARTADSSASIAATLSSSINSAVNVSQQSKTKVEALQNSLTALTDKERLTTMCLNDVKRITDSINAAILTVNTKANSTALSAQLTKDNLTLTSNTTNPVKQTFQNLSTSTDNSLRSLDLTQDQITALLNGQNKNTQTLADVNNRLYTKKSDFDRLDKANFLPN